METTRGRRENTKDRSTELSELLKEALQRPGVREVMEVYQDWNTPDEVVRSCRDAQGVQRIVSASSDSIPRFSVRR